MESREYTPEEVRAQFLRAVHACVEYWKQQPEAPDFKLEMLAFSIMVVLDGEGSDLPPFLLAPNPGRGEREVMQEAGKNWYPENLDAQVRANISGQLHKRYFLPEGIPPRP